MTQLLQRLKATSPVAFFMGEPFLNQVLYAVYYTAVVVLIYTIFFESPR